MAKFLVSGVAGYIGSTVAKLLLESGHSVIGIDNLSTGMPEFVDPKVEFVPGDIMDLELMLKLGQKVDGIIHLAGIKFAGESYLAPEIFYRVNTLGSLNAGLAALETKSKIIVFSSSCSVYGNVNGFQVSEATPLKPISPYGRSKLMSETVLNDLSIAHKLSVVSLRFFNVIGATQLGAYDKSKFNLFPNLCRAIQNGGKIQIFGSNLPTKDGSCIRDYVDVNDIASAHVLVAEKMLKKEMLKNAYNLGCAKGTSVLEIVKAFEEIVNKEIFIDFCEPREGDPYEITSNFEAAKADLGWEPQITLLRSIESQLIEFLKGSK
jgi:UDP-glucose 4-epimerase